MKSFAVLIALSLLGTVLAQEETLYEVGKQGDAPDSPKITPLTDLEIQGDWKAEKIGDNESPVDDLYIHFDDKGATVIEGKYKDWKGGLVHGDGEINFYRKPTAEEMSEKAPQWAREKVSTEGKLEWKLSLKAESRKGEWLLEGKWYPGQFKWNETGEGADAKQEASYLDEGKPVDVKFKKLPVIVRTIVLNDQTGYYKGLPWHPYPFVFRPPAGMKAVGHSLIAPPPRNGLGEEGDARTLFVCGRSLPTSYDKKIEIRGADNTIKYQVMALAADGNLSADHKRLFKAGWDRVVKGLDSDTEKIVRKCGAMLVRADLQRGVTAGVKKFTLNNLTDSWRLGFGDNGGELTFARDVTANANEDIDCACLPENIYVEIRTETVFPTQEIALRAQLNGEDVKWNGADTLVAKYVKDVPTPQSYEVPRAGEAAEVVPRVIRVYRTPAIQVGGQASPNDKGYHLNAKATDVLAVKPDDPLLFTFRPAIASVKFWDGPDHNAAGEKVSTWDETVRRAAILDGLGEQVKAGKNVTGSEAAAISNVVVTNIAFGKLRPAGESARQSLNDSLHSWTTLTPLWAPAMAWRFFFGSKGILTERVAVTVADHAALLLFKEAFMRKMSMGLNGLEKNTKTEGSEDAQRALWTGIREGLKVSAARESSPWESIRVPGPNGGEVKMSWALDDGLRKQACKGMTDSATEEWSLRAVQNGIGQYKENIKHAIQKAKDTPDNDVKKLIELIGYGYENLLPEVMQHMMWHGPPDATTPLWQPHLNPRFALWNLHTGADAIRAQEDLSKLDSQMVMLAASALAAPFMLSENLFVSICLYSMDVAMLEGQLITETVPELWEQYQRNEIRFALGASLVLGTDRLNEAELKKTEWFQTVLSVLPSAMGVAMGGASFHEMTRATAKAKAALSIDTIEKHGMAGVKNLQKSDKVALLIHASEAETVKEMGAAKMLEASHERAAAAAEKLAAEAGAARHARAKANTHVVQATGNAAEEAKAVTAEVRYASEEEKAVTTPTRREPDRAGSETKEPVAFPEDASSVKKGGTQEPITLPEGADSSVKKGTGTVVGADAREPVKQNKNVSTNLDELKKANALRTENGQNVDENPLEMRVIMPDNTEERFTLGRFLGKGSVAMVYEVVAGKFKNAVAKFFYKGDGFRTPGKIAADQVAISKKLTDGNIPHLKVREVPGCAGGDPPFVIQEQLPQGATVFGDGTDTSLVYKFVNREGPGGQLDGPGEAYAKLQRRLADLGLDAEDLGWKNVYWIGSDDHGWVCGILDVDHILGHAARNSPMGARIDWVEAEISRKTVRSLFAAERRPIRPRQSEFQRKFFKDDLEHTMQVNGDDFIKRTPAGRVGPYFPSSEFFAEKMFEHKGWLKCEWLDQTGNVTNSAQNAVRARLKDGMLKLKHVEKYFPLINDPARSEPLDLRGPFQSPGPAPDGTSREVPAWVRRLAEFSQKQFFTRPSSWQSGAWFPELTPVAA